MSTSLYTISFKDTANVLTYCSFEKQELVDQAAWDNLRDKLVGDKLSLSISSKWSFEVPAALLAADPVPGTPSSEFLSNPLKYQVAMPAPGPVKPGDGNDKILQQPPVNSVNTVLVKQASGTTPATVTFTLTQLVTAIVPATLFINGQGPFAGSMQASAADVKFALPVSVPIAAGTQYELLFFMTGVPYWHSTETAQ